MKSKIIIAAVVVLLAGCETMQQKSQALIEQERIVKQVQGAFENSKPCVDEVNKNPDVIKIHQEILFENENSANKYQLMLIKEKPTQEQINLLVTTVPVLKKCRVILTGGLNNTPYYQVMMRRFSALDSMYVKLMRGEITIGSANEEKSKIDDEQKIDWANAEAQLNERLMQMYNAEMAGRRQAAAAMMPFIMQQQQNMQAQQQLMYQQQMQNIYNNRQITNPTTTTNCSAFGNQINCTTR